MSGKGKIEKSTNLLHADRILAEVRKIWPKAWEGWLKCWANGREQGYWLQATHWGKNYSSRGAAACVFSEGRSCDGALVVVGRTTEFDYQTNHPSDKVWERNRRYFYDTTGLNDKDGGPKTWDESLRGRGDKLAAKWIVKMLRALIAEDRAENRRLAKEHKAAEKAKAS